MKNTIDDILKDISLDEINACISNLQKLDLASQDFDEMKKMVLPLIQCGLSVVTFPKNRQIHRGRPVDIREEVLKHVKQISYPPKKNLMKYNRASSGAHQIFYGTVSEIRDEQELAHIGVNFELSQIHKESFGSDFEYIGLGRWHSTEDFSVVVAGLDSKIANNNKAAITLRGYQASLINELPERFEVIKVVSEFLSSEFSKVIEHEYEYKITAAFGEVLFEMGFDAIMFPSVKTDGHVFNIALSKELVDSCLVCEVAAITRSRKIKGEVFGDYLLVSETINIDGTFNWSEPPSSAVLSNAAIKQIEREIDEKGRFESTNWIIQ